MITRARVEGMMCQHCVRAVFTALAGVEGIEKAEVGLGWIEVEHGDGRLNLEELRRAVAVVGYEVVEERRVLPVLGAKTG